jgi:hypothetical protein
LAVGKAQASYSEITRRLSLEAIRRLVELGLKATASPFITVTEGLKRSRLDTRN